MNAMKKITLFAGIWLSVAFNASALPLCKLVNSACLDNTPCKTISGTAVCLSGVTPPAGGINVTQTCWDQQSTYNCDTLNIDTCTGNVPSNCTQTSSVCAQSDQYQYITQDSAGTWYEATSSGNVPQLGITVSISGSTWTYNGQSGAVQTNPAYGSCMLYTNTYSCTSPQVSTTTCTPNEPGTGCTLQSNICTTRDASGTCTQYQSVYSCVVPEQTITTNQTSQTTQQNNDCQSISQACTLKAQNCLDNPPGPLASCNTIENVYSCPTGTTTTTTTSCSGQELCVNSSCYTTKDGANTAFGAAAAGLELAREAGTYLDPKSLTVFGGESDSCTDVLSGLFKCCKVSTTPSPAGNNFNAIGAFMGAMQTNGLANTASDMMQNSLGIGSKYVYDSLMTGNGWLSNTYADIGAIKSQASAFLNQLNPFSPAASAADQAAGSASGGAAGVGSSGPFSFYGVSVSFTMGPGGIAMNFAFDPYAFAIAVGIQMLESMVACTTDEMQLDLKRGQNLCHQVGSYCSTSALGLCLATTQSFCCFNSRLSLLINEQGRPQIGKSWGSPQTPDCSGFTMTQLADLNFSAMDLSSFYQEVNNAANMPNLASLQGQTQSKLSQITSGYTTGGASTTIANLGAPMGQTTPIPTQTPTTSGATPQVAACTVSWGAKVATQNITPSDMSSSINVTSCQPNGTITWLYSGCNFVGPTPYPSVASSSSQSMTLDSTGSGSLPITVPAACLQPGMLNTWNGAVNVNGVQIQSLEISW